MVTIDEPLTPKMPSPAATSAGSPCRTNGSQAHPPLGPRTVRFDRETDNEISGDARRIAAHPTSKLSVRCNGPARSL